jgi:hypothetical protein
MNPNEIAPSDRKAEVEDKRAENLAIECGRLRQMVEMRDRTIETISDQRNCAWCFAGAAIIAAVATVVWHEVAR